MSRESVAVLMETDIASDSTEVTSETETPSQHHIADAASFQQVRHISQSQVRKIVRSVFLTLLTPHETFGYAQHDLDLTGRNRKQRHSQFVYQPR